MGSTLNLSLTDELRAFVDEQSGDGTLYATPSEFVRDLLRKHKLHMEAEELRTGVIEGFQDAAENRVHQFKGSVRELVRLGGVRLGFRDSVLVSFRWTFDGE